MLVKLDHETPNFQDFKYNKYLSKSPTPGWYHHTYTYHILPLKTHHASRFYWRVNHHHSHHYLIHREKKLRSLTFNLTPPRLTSDTWPRGEGTVSAALARLQWMLDPGSSERSPVIFPNETSEATTKQIVNCQHCDFLGVSIYIYAY